MSKVVKVRTDRRRVELPTKVNVPPPNFIDYCLLFYGVKGVGKTSVAASIPNSIVLMLEPRRRNLRIKQWPVEGPQPTWLEIVEFLGLCREKRIRPIIDTVDEAYFMCQKHVGLHYGKEFGSVSEVSEMPSDYWIDVREEFAKHFNQLLYDDIGVVFLSHAKPRAMETTEVKAMQTAPTCTPACWKYLKSVCDFAFYYGNHGKDRAMWLRGEDPWTGCGVDDHFLSPAGEPVRILPIPYAKTNGGQVAWETLLKSWDNKLYDMDESEKIENKAAATKGKKFFAK